MTDEEAAAYRTRTLAEQADDDRAPTVHAKWWLDYGKELTSDKRTSLIVDPPMFEYACHEGNYGLENILGNARAEERVGAETGK